VRAFLIQYQRGLENRPTKAVECLGVPAKLAEQLPSAEPGERTVCVTLRLGKAAA
jgi:hypothetical protein